MSEGKVCIARLETRRKSWEKSSCTDRSASTMVVLDSFPARNHPVCVLLVELKWRWLHVCRQRGIHIARTFCFFCMYFRFFKVGMRVSSHFCGVFLLCCEELRGRKKSSAPKRLKKQRRAKIKKKKDKKCFKKMRKRSYSFRAATLERPATCNASGIRENK